MKRVVICILILLFAISCNNKEEINVPNIQIDSTSKQIKDSINYYTVTFSDSNLILQYIVSPFGIEEHEIGAKINDRISKINFKQWDTVAKNSIILEYQSSNTAENNKIISDYKNSKNNFEKAKKQFEDEDINKQELINIETQFLINKKKYDSFISKTAVAAPFNCVISEISVKKGQSIEIGQVLLKISKIDTIKAKINISDTDYKLISKDITPEIRINDKIIKGKFGKFRKVNKKDDFYENEIIFPNKTKDINIKDSLTIFIDTKTKNNRIYLPVSAVKIENDTYVKLLLENNKIEKRNITVGNIKNDSIEVMNGLKNGDKIILN